MLTDRKKALTMILARANPAPEAEPAGYGDGDDSGVLACAGDLIAGVEAKDARRVAGALRDAFAILGAQPGEAPAE